MKKIYKYEVPLQKVFRLKLPALSDILCVQNQFGVPHIWATVDPENETEERVFEIYGTGEEIKNDDYANRRYIGTFQLEEGRLVFHLFERALY